MKIVSVNIGEVTTVDYLGKEVKTGIFKYPVDDSIFLGDTDVKNDNVVDRRYHGGVDKATYAYSLDHYAFWKNLYPDLDWTNGMFGENLTIEGLDEAKMLVGSVYKVGEAKIQVCQPREPCFKLGIRFNTQSVLKTFVNELFCGVYFRVIQPGRVNSEDELKLEVEESDSPSIAEVYSFMYHKGSGTKDRIENAINCNFLPVGIREGIRKTQSA